MHEVKLIWSLNETQNHRNPNISFDVWLMDLHLRQASVYNYKWHLLRIHILLQWVSNWAYYLYRSFIRCCWFTQLELCNRSVFSTIVDMGIVTKCCVGYAGNSYMPPILRYQQNRHRIKMPEDNVVTKVKLS